LRLAANLEESRHEEFAAPRKQQLQTSRAWGLKDDFRWFWMHLDAKTAQEFFKDWHSWAIRSQLPPMQKGARMLKERLPNILT